MGGGGGGPIVEARGGANATDAASAAAAKGGAARSAAASDVVAVALHVGDVGGEQAPHAVAVEGGAGDQQHVYDLRLTYYDPVVTILDGDRYPIELAASTI